MAPMISYFALNGQYKLSFYIFVLSGITDFLDGYIARNYNLKTVIGTVLDPMADKILIISLTITLTYIGLIPIYLTALFFARCVEMG